MNNKKNYKKGTRLEIIKTIHMASILPFKAIATAETPRTYKDKIREMTKEGILSEFKVKINRRTYRIFTLTDFEKNRRMYKNNLPDGYYEQFVTVGQQNVRDCRTKKGSVSMHVIAGATTHIMMKLAGVACEPDTRPSLFKKDEPIDDECSYYYSSREIKNYTGYKNDIKTTDETAGDGLKQVISSRITGLLISKGGIYATYNMGCSITNWQKGGELKIKTHIDYLIGDKLSNPYPCDSALLMLEEYDSLSKIFVPTSRRDEKAVSSFSNLAVAYRKIYAIPCDRNGRRMIEIMSSGNWMADIKSSLLMGYNKEYVETTGVVCDDYTDNEEYVLLFCIPDLSRLLAFKNYAEINPNRSKYIVLCFDFQKELVAKSCGMFCRILTVKFEEYYNEFKKNRE